MSQQFSLGKPLRDHAGGDFLIPPSRFTAENDRFSHSLAAEDFRFHFRGMHFFAGNIN